MLVLFHLLLGDLDSTFPRTYPTALLHGSSHSPPHPFVTVGRWAFGQEVCHLSRRVGVLGSMDDTSEDTRQLIMKLSKSQSQSS